MNRISSIYKLAVPDSGLARLGVVADTHVPDRIKALPPRLFELLAGVDLILHAGDLTHPRILDELKQVAPVVAVQGNGDLFFRANWRRPMLTVIEVGEMKIGLTHGHGGLADYIKEKFLFFATEGYRYARYERQVRRWFNGVQAIVFGHTHYPVNVVNDGVLLFNPGSVGPDYRAWFGASIGRLTVNMAQRQVVGEILPLGEPIP